MLIIECSLFYLVNKTSKAPKKFRRAYSIEISKDFKKLGVLNVNFYRLFNKKKY